MPDVVVGPLEELPPGAMKLVEVDATLTVGVFNCGGTLYALEDRCSHDDGPLCEGDWDDDECVVVCPRHGSSFDLSSGVPRSLPAFEPVRTFPVRAENGLVVLQVG